MAQNLFSLSSQPYQENMRAAFSLSQQNGDFVDLTLAADGHFVKAHQLILGVASPYIKNLIQSAKCNHPVIFLNDVSYTILCSLLEYVYTGEVAVAEENLQSFLSVAKALCIQGLDVDISTAEDIDDIIDIVDIIDVAKDDTQSVQIQVINDEANLIPLEEKETPTKTVSSNFDKSQYGIKRKADKQNDSFSWPPNKTSKQTEDIEGISQLDIVNETTKQSLIIGYANRKLELAPVSDLSVDYCANNREVMNKQVISMDFESDDSDIQQLSLSSSSSDDSDDSDEDDPMFDDSFSTQGGKLLLNHRIKNYVEKVVPRYSREEFKSHFRMYPETFEFVLQLVEQILSKSTAVNGRRSIPAKKQLLLVIWIMATPASLRSICAKFNVGRGTILRTLRRVTRALNCLAPHFIQWPKGETAQEVMNQFEEFSAFPKVIGAIDGAHIKTKAPVHESHAKEKSYHIIQVQAVCTQNLMFTNVFAASAGYVHDASIFRLSEVQQYIETPGEYFPSNSHIVGDAAYGIHPCIMTPFTDNGILTESQKNFNSCLLSAKMSIEKAIGLWKARWRRILGCLPMTKIEEIPEFLLATCVLHNICILKKDLISFQEVLRVRNRGRLIEDDGFRGSFKRTQIMNTLTLSNQKT